MPLVHYRVFSDILPTLDIKLQVRQRRSGQPDAFSRKYFYQLLQIGIVSNHQGAVHRAGQVTDGFQVSFGPTSIKLSG
jgi:hypothetical protein